jgi:outer membrane lipoprotein SlyB
MACGLRGPTITEIERQHMKVNMNTISRSAVPALALAMLTLGLPAAQAADSAASQPAKTVHGVKLSSLCQDCGVVNDVHTETREGKASGVGAVGGAVLGGVLGHQLGGGTGKTLATAAGAVGGGVAGNAVEKKAKQQTVWITRVTFRDGSAHQYELSSNPGLKAGDVVRLQDGHPVKTSS